MHVDGSEALHEEISEMSLIEAHRLFSLLSLVELVEVPSLLPQEVLRRTSSASLGLADALPWCCPGGSSASASARLQDGQDITHLPLRTERGRVYRVYAGAAVCLRPTASRRANSSSLSLTLTAATFSSRCFTLVVPGIGSITGLRLSNQASATAPGVTAC
jgi:hypothetical protein